MSSMRSRYYRTMRHDLTSLQIFIAVAECGNLTRAAEREHLAVSAVSKRISELEDQVGTPLLQRFARGVGLTPAGQSLLHHARQILQQIKQMDAELGDYARGIKGHVRIHAVASALTQFLPQDIGAFAAQYPLVQLTIEERTGNAIARAVAEGAADLGILTQHTALRGLDSTPYHVDTLVLGLPRGHRLARRKAIDFASVLDEEFIGPHADSSLAALMTEQARAHGQTLRQRVRASSFDAMSRLVEAKLGIALLPQGAIARDVAAGRIKALRLTDAWAQRQLLVVARAWGELDPIARTLVAHLQRCAGVSPRA